MQADEQYVLVPLISLILIHRGMKVFQACAVVNVKTDGIFLRVTQKGKSV